MKPPVSPVQTSARSPIVETFSVIWLTACLITGLTACSSAGNKPVAQTSPIEETPTVTAAPLAEQSMDEQAARSQKKTIRMREGHPRQYTVKKGDTLWDISSLFLKDPWYWPEVWHKNRQVENPHLIYPGDVLTLIYVNEQPQIVVGDTVQTTAPPRPTTTPPIPKSTGPGLRVVKLGPQIRRDSIDANVQTIPGDAIRQFLTRPRVVTEDELEQAPYILASEGEHLIIGQDNRVYIRGELDKDRVRFNVFRPGKELVDPETDDTLGYEAIYAGELHVTQYGDPATAILTSTEREVLLGDRLLPLDKSQIRNMYYPRVPEKQITGQVVSLFDALFGIGKFQIAVINRGSTDGIEVGHILASLTAGTTVDDYFAGFFTEDVKLPDERSGLMMIFKTFDRVSYGLIMESTNVIQQNDTVVTPR